jgi:hypothetical protein
MSLLFAFGTSKIVFANTLTTPMSSAAFAICGAIKTARSQTGLISVYRTTASALGTKLLSDLVVQIGDLPFDTEVSIGVDDCGGFCSVDDRLSFTMCVNVIGSCRDKFTCVGWSDRSAQVVESYSSREHLHYWVRDGYRLADSAAQSTFLYWIQSSTKVLHKQSILYPNQVCAICLLPAPHKVPNEGEKFVCTFCAVLGEIKDG